MKTNRVYKPFGVFHLSLMFLIVIIMGCSKRKSESNSSGNLPRERTLHEKRDDKGRLVITVVTGFIPGEDIFLTITRFDTLGRITVEYGAKPYGEKFKTTYMYDSKDRVIMETSYDFSNVLSGEFENYKTNYELYSLADTAANFESPASRHKIVYQYNDDKELTTETHYLSVDTLKLKRFQFLRDTVYKTKVINTKDEADQ